MSIQTELARIKGAKADLRSWVEENGVTVPDGTLIDGLVELAKTVETGGGGGDTQIDGLIDRNITEISNSRVTKIGNNAFNNCNKLTTADFPAVTSIDANAFNNCTSLINVNIPAVKSMMDSVFYFCTSLTAVDFPALTSIGNGVFQFCTSLTAVDFTALTSIGSVAFFQCNNLTALILRKTDIVCKLSSYNALSNTPIASGTGYIYVPSALVDSYKAATNWATYADQIRAIEDYPDITGGAA